jgi:hypothetical protein
VLHLVVSTVRGPSPSPSSLGFQSGIAHALSIETDIGTPSVSGRTSPSQQVRNTSHAMVFYVYHGARPVVNLCGLVGTAADCFSPCGVYHLAYQSQLYDHFDSYVQFHGNRRVRF